MWRLASVPHRMPSSTMRTRSVSPMPMPCRYRLNGCPATTDWSTIPVGPFATTSTSHNPSTADRFLITMKRYRPKPSQVIEFICPGIRTTPSSSTSVTPLSPPPGPLLQMTFSSHRLPPMWPTRNSKCVIVFTTSLRSQSRTKPMCSLRPRSSRNQGKSSVAACPISTPPWPWLAPMLSDHVCAHPSWKNDMPFFPSTANTADPCFSPIAGLGCVSVPTEESATPLFRARFTPSPPPEVPWSERTGLSPSPSLDRAAERAACGARPGRMEAASLVAAHCDSWCRLYASASSVSRNDGFNPFRVPCCAAPESGFIAFVSRTSFILLSASIASIFASCGSSAPPGAKRAPSTFGGGTKERSLPPDPLFPAAVVLRGRVRMWEFSFTPFVVGCRSSRGSALKTGFKYTPSLNFGGFSPGRGPGRGRFGSRASSLSRSRTRASTSSAKALAVRGLFSSSFPFAKEDVRTKYRETRSSSRRERSGAPARPPEAGHKCIDFRVVVVLRYR
mmetsp:Transcript_26266/g.66223  ORF Transcript_26266/g.66223 Transcript_26266/m.66223 type:complete len:504 (-) Transcript_26266:301-1812(-)